MMHTQKRPMHKKVYMQFVIIVQLIHSEFGPLDNIPNAITKKASHFIQYGVKLLGKKILICINLEFA